MADLEIDIPTLKGKSTELSSLKGKATSTYDKCIGSYLCTVGDPISKLKEIVKAPMERFKNGYELSDTWFSNYLSDLESVESGLEAFKGTNVTAPTTFNGKFEDIFGKVTMPVLKTNGDKEANYKTFGGGVEESTEQENINETQTSGNIIDTSQPAGTGKSYNLTNQELNYLAYVAKREQGSVEGAKIELSLMVNLYEKNKSKYKSVVDYVKRSGWFAKRSINNYTYPGDDYANAAKEVISQGKRYLASNVVEHDCLSDIKSISTGSVKNRSNYIPGKTIIRNVYGSKYVFVGFAPNGGDPFGYLV